MANNMKSETSNIDNPPNLEDQLDSSKSNFYPNSAYRSAIKQNYVKVIKSVGVVTKYIDAMNAYDALKSDENYNYLEVVKKEYKEFLESK